MSGVLPLMILRPFCTIAPFLLFSVLSCTSKEKAETGPDENRNAWSLYAVEFARSKDVSVDRLVKGARADQRVDMSWYFWVARGFGKTILIDTGTDAFIHNSATQLRHKWNIHSARSVRASLNILGIQPEGVSDVFITHHHWDHSDGLIHFERANIYIDEVELSSLKRKASKDVLGFLERARLRGALLTPLQSNEEKLPQFLVERAGQHTKGHRIVKLRCGGKNIIVSGDAAYLYQNLSGRLPITQSQSFSGNLQDLGKMLDWVGSDGEVLPGHDPDVFFRHEIVGHGVVKICGPKGGLS